MNCYRQKRFDNKFTEFASKNKLIILNELMMQQIDYSYRNGEYSAQLDHILYSEKIKCKNKNKNVVIQVNVVEDSINVSDHHAVQLKIWRREKSSNLKVEVVKTEEMIEIKPDLEIDENRIKMLNNFEKNMYMINMKNLGGIEETLKIEEIYNNINKAIKCAYQEMVVLKTKREFKINWWKN